MKTTYYSKGSADSEGDVLKERSSTSQNSFVKSKGQAALKSQRTKIVDDVFLSLNNRVCRA